MRKISLSGFSWGWCLALVVVGYGIFLFCAGFPIKGPFIFGDELLYFSFSRSIFRGESIGSTYLQYGPLYPVLMAPAFYLKNIHHSYQLMRFLNIILFLSATIPAYFLGKALFENRWLRGLLPVCVLITPFCGFTYLIWAEPLYLALFYWTCFLLLQYVKEPNLTKSLVLGILLSLLYYSKPGAGLVAQIAMLFSLIVFMLVTWNSQSRKVKILSGIIILTCFLLDLPWMLHYMDLGASIIGYPCANADLAWRLTHEGYLAVFFSVAKSLFFQFSYVFVGTWGLIGIGVVALITQWRSLSDIERVVALFAMMYVFGQIALSALGLASARDLDFKMPNGRYFSVCLALLTTLSLSLCFKRKAIGKQDTRLLFSVVLFTTAIAILASPLYVRGPLAFISMPELASIIMIENNGRIIWRATVEEPSFLLRIGVPMFFGGFALGVLWLRKQSYTLRLAVLIVFVGSLYAAAAEVYCVRAIALGPSNLNKIYIYMKAHQIDPSKVLFDKKMEKIGNLQFFTPFWMEKLPVYKSIEEIKRKPGSIVASYFISEDTLNLNKLTSIGQFTIYKIHTD